MNSNTLNQVTLNPEQQEAVLHTEGAASDFGGSRLRKDPRASRTGRHISLSRE